MTAEEALQTLLKPLYERYGELGETLEEFTDLFLDMGGKIQIEIPPELQERMSNEEVPTTDIMPPTFE